MLTQSPPPRPRALVPCRYHVQYTPKFLGVWLDANGAGPGGPDCPVLPQCEVMGLDPGCRYLFRVRAYNTFGWGPFTTYPSEVWTRTPGKGTRVIIRLCWLPVTCLVVPASPAPALPPQMVLLQWMCSPPHRRAAPGPAQVRVPLPNPLFLVSCWRRIAACLSPRRPLAALVCLCWSAGAGARGGDGNEAAPVAQRAGHFPCRCHSGSPPRRRGRVRVLAHMLTMIMCGNAAVPGGAAVVSPPS